MSIPWTLDISSPDYCTHFSFQLRQGLYCLHAKVYCSDWSNHIPTRVNTLHLLVAVWNFYLRPSFGWSRSKCTELVMFDPCDSPLPLTQEVSLVESGWRFSKHRALSGTCYRWCFDRQVQLESLFRDQYTPMFFRHCVFILLCHRSNSATRP